MTRVIRPLTARIKRAFIDTCSEVAAALMSRPGRAWLNIVGVAIGVSSLVATVGVTQTAGYEILANLRSLDRTLIRVTPAQLGGEAVMSWEAEDSVRRISGVESTGSTAVVIRGAAVATSLSHTSPTVGLDVLTASHGLVDAVEGEMVEGRFFDPLLDETPYRTAILGAGAARLLDYDQITPGHDALFIEGIPFSVIGIMDSSRDEPGLSNVVLISRGSLGRDISPQTMYVRADRGATDVVASQLAVVVNPNHPNRIAVAVPVNAADLQAAVEADVDSLFVILGLVALLVAAIATANTTLISVMERKQEIGLRRALGATRRRIGAEFLTESTVTGVTGGVVGVSIGVIVVVASATARGWLPVLDPVVPVLGVLIGALTGMLSGVYPAIRAARLEPTEALRSV